MKKIYILNFITSFRKEPNAIKTHEELLNHLGKENAPAIDQMLSELQQTRAIRATERDGQKAYQVISR